LDGRDNQAWQSPVSCCAVAVVVATWVISELLVGMVLVPFRAMLDGAAVDVPLVDGRLDEAELVSADCEPGCT
jgi:hypothetical protein